MAFVRWLGIVALPAALAACSGNIGGGQSTLPGTPQSGANTQSYGQAEPSPTPASASNVATLGNTGPQALPAVAGWSGSVAFSNPSAAPSASPRPPTKAPAAVEPAGPVSVGITAAVVAPTDAPRFPGSGSKRHGKHDSTSPTPLLFITLLATSDVTFAQYPKFEIDVPRAIASKHRDDVFALALYDPQEKSKSFRLGAVARDPDASSPEVLPAPTATPLPSPSPTSTGSAFGPGSGAMSFTPPPVGGDQSGLPPQAMSFLATASALTLRENRPVVFALYVVAPAPSASPSGSPSPAGSAIPMPAPSPATTASPSAPARPVPVNTAPAPSATSSLSPGQ